MAAALDEEVRFRCCLGGKVDLGVVWMVESVWIVE